MRNILTLFTMIGVKLFKNGPSKICARHIACLSRPDHFRFFKGCPPNILLGPFLNTLSHIHGIIDGRLPPPPPEIVLPPPPYSDMSPQHHFKKKLTFRYLKTLVFDKFFKKLEHYLMFLFSKTISSDN